MTREPSISAPAVATDRIREEGSAAPVAAHGTPIPSLERVGVLYARLALGAAFLSAVASRFGVWTGNLGLARFDNFIRYTAEVNAFMPASTIPFLAWSATAAELFLGTALVLGLWPRRVALGSALLLAMFGTAMAVSQGLKSPLDYSVFSASAGALLLASAARGTGHPRSSPPRG
ncbi:MULTISPECIES: DoxX family protein [Myxococcus]|uniref:DoxX family protein n=1 Tax=Myxococcus llanfairpwllgwyngyllgogerychwyrndrobwllllantysiliogogogochensis TaxID=2590453 RepID=A0A540X7E4_9BACT|nr:MULTISPECIES: DoxX family protein [Myxococcus]NTX01713.1 DoxX family protein [Myxococcus sp. CA040A]TQF17130.1 DoxX family protein [Myxococcus llanfairpwllgwyngyllgogerychwyrndrobwllllantysiliogogogochensis]